MRTPPSCRRTPIAVRAPARDSHDRVPPRCYGHRAQRHASPPLWPSRPWAHPEPGHRLPHTSDTNQNREADDPVQLHQPPLARPPLSSPNLGTRPSPGSAPSGLTPTAPGSPSSTGAPTSVTTPHCSSRSASPPRSPPGCRSPRSTGTCPAARTSTGGSWAPTGGPRCPTSLPGRSASTSTPHPSTTPTPGTCTHGVGGVRYVVVAGVDSASDGAKKSGPGFES